MGEAVPSTASPSSGLPQCRLHLVFRGQGLRGDLRLTWSVRVRIAAQVAHALSHLHARGITHRDINCSNIFLDSDLNAKLGDVGLAASGARQGWGGCFKPLAHLITKLHIKGVRRNICQDSLTSSEVLQHFSLVFVRWRRHPGQWER